MGNLHLTCHVSRHYHWEKSLEGQMLRGGFLVIPRTPDFFCSWLLKLPTSSAFDYSHSPLLGLLSFLTPQTPNFLGRWASRLLLLPTPQTPDFLGRRASQLLWVWLGLLVSYVTSLEQSNNQMQPCLTSADLFPFTLCHHFLKDSCPLRWLSLIWCTPPSFLDYMPAHLLIYNYPPIILSSPFSSSLLQIF